MLVPLGRAPTWHFHTKLYKFRWNSFPNNAGIKNRTDLNLGEVVCLSIISHIPDSWRNLLNGDDFYFQSKPPVRKCALARPKYTCTARVVQYTRTDTIRIMASSFPYDSYGSWNNGLRVVQLVNRISLERLRVCIQVHDPYDSFDSYGSWNNGLRVVQLVNRISLERLGVCIQVHDPYDSFDSYGS